MVNPRFSICIPSFKRPHELRANLDSILQQTFGDYEVVVCEDCSPEPDREEYRVLSLEYGMKFGGRLRVIFNPVNLGYDKNLRATADHAKGEFVVFMGDDDLMAPDALEKLNAVINRHPDVGFVLRSYSTFKTVSSNVTQVHRYYPEEARFEAGADTIVKMFHRAVLVSGLTVNRASALRFRTDKVNGTLYYQQYVIGMTLSKMPAVSTPHVMVFNRNIPISKTVFGSAGSEQGFWEPGKRSVESSVYQMQQYLKVGRLVEQDSGLPVYRGIRNELSKYSYAFLVLHSEGGKWRFLKYARELFRCGFGREPFFHIYVVGLFILGPRICNSLITRIKQHLGYTPQL